MKQNEIDKIVLKQIQNFFPISFGEQETLSSGGTEI